MAWRRVLIPVVLVLAGFGAEAGPASAAATDTITVVSAGSPATSVGDMQVVVDSTTPLTTFAAHVYTASGTLELSPAMTQTSQTTTSIGYQSTWTVTSLIKQGRPPAGLPLGIYNITVDATDSGGTSVSGVPAGTLDFVDEPELTLTTTNTANISVDNPTATVTGTASLLEPSGTVVPYEGIVALVRSWNGASFTVTSSAAGDFSAVVSPYGAGWETVYAEMPVPIEGNMIASGDVGFAVQVDPSLITAKMSAPTVIYGGKDTVTGVLTYQPSYGAAYKPLAGQTVSVDDGSTTPVGTGVTNASGVYSISVPTNTYTTGWQVEAGSGVYSSLLGFSSAGAVMYVDLPTALSGVQVSLNQHWGLSFSGCLNLRQDVSDAFLYMVPGIELQYADSMTGPWHTLAQVSTTDAACGHSGATFQGTATAAVNYAYYRVIYTGSGSTPPAEFDYGYLASSSSPALVWKYADRITGFGVSATVVGPGGKLTVHGQLEYYSSGWHPYPGQQVLIIFRPNGSSTWYWIEKVPTNTTGHFAATFTDPKSATWAALYEGNSTHLDCMSATAYVRVSGSSAVHAGVGTAVGFRPGELAHLPEPWRTTRQ